MRLVKLVSDKTIPSREADAQIARRQLGRNQWSAPPEAPLAFERRKAGGAEKTSRARAPIRASPGKRASGVKGGRGAPAASLSFCRRREIGRRQAEQSLQKKWSGEPPAHHVARPEALKPPRRISGKWQRPVLGRCLCVTYSTSRGAQPRLFLKQFTSSPQLAPLAGRNVGQFD